MKSNNLSRRSWLKSSVIGLGALGIMPVEVLGKGPDRQNILNTKWVPGSPLKEYTSAMVFPPDVCRLNANENPYGPSAKALEAFAGEMKGGNRYAWRSLFELIDKIAGIEGVSREQIIMGPGSSDLLEKVGMLYFTEEGNIVTADPCYMSMIQVAKAMGGEWRPVKLTEDFQHDLKAMEEAVDGNTKLVYITNPNNPTASITHAKDLYDFCDRVSQKVPVFVDEAYLELSKNGLKDSMAPLVAEGRNVFVFRTFSKIHGMAGLRIGYMIGNKEALEEIGKITRGGMGITAPSVRAASASLDDQDFLNACKVKINEAKDYTVTFLKNHGFEPIPSETNFVIFPITMDPEQFLSSMMAKGVAVRAFNFWEKDWCRVSIGTLEEMQQFTAAVQEILL